MIRPTHSDEVEAAMNGISPVTTKMLALASALNVELYFVDFPEFADKGAALSLGPDRPVGRLAVNLACPDWEEHVHHGLRQVWNLCLARQVTARADRPHPPDRLLDYPTAGFAAYLASVFTTPN